MQILSYKVSAVYLFNLIDGMYVLSTCIEELN